VLTHHNVHMRECNLHCLPVAADKCACTGHLADECIHRYEGGKMVMRPFAKVLRTLDLCCSILMPVNVVLGLVALVLIQENGI